MSLRGPLIAALLVGTTGSALAAGLRELRFDIRPISLDAAVKPLALRVENTMSVAETRDEIRIELPADILFDFDQAVIRAEAREALAAAAKVLRAHPSGRVVFSGHADSKGNEAHNLPLSMRRARAVQAWLSGQENVPTPKASVKGFGAGQPAVPNTKPDGSDDPEGRQRNRRVEILITK